MYVAIHTRSNIVFAIGRLSQYLVDLAKHYDQALKTLLRYLRSIVNKDLMYRSNESSHLIEYLNLDYAVDRVNRKFILEYAYAI
jgi:hypothetical protein